MANDSETAEQAEMAAHYDAQAGGPIVVEWRAA